MTLSFCLQSVSWIRSSSSIVGWSLGSKHNFHAFEEKHNYNKQQSLTGKKPSLTFFIPKLSTFNNKGKPFQLPLQNITSWDGRTVDQSADLMLVSNAQDFAIGQFKLELPLDPEALGKIIQSVPQGMTVNNRSPIQRDLMKNGCILPCIVVRSV